MEKKQKAIMLMQLIKCIANNIPDFIYFMALFVAAIWICSAVCSSLVKSTKSTS